MKEKVIFVFDKCLRTPKLPDELAQHVSNKSFSDQFFHIFLSKVQNIAVFSTIYMIRNRFFGPRELI